MEAGRQRRRLFVAAALDEPARAICIAAGRALLRAGFCGTYAPPENLHLTVAFVGAVEDRRIDDVARAVRAATNVLVAFDVPLETLGAFPSARQPRVAWVGPAEPVLAFADACAIVRRSLGALGFAFEPHDDAHVTLARAGGRAPLPGVDIPVRGTHAVRALTLYESRSGPGGVRYEALERFPFAIAAAPERSIEP